MIIVAGGDKAHIANADKLAQAISQPSTSISTSSAMPVSSFSVATSASYAASPEAATEETTGVFERLDLSALQYTRVTFIGHGTTARFGSNSNKGEEHPGYTPQEFVAELKTRGLSPAVRTIDLFACNVGLTDESGKSYASEVAALFKQDPQYQHIQLRAFTVDASAYSREIISVEKEAGKAYVFGVKKENESVYQQKSEEIASIRKNLKLIGDRIDEAKLMLTKYSNSRIVKESSEKRIAALNQQLAEATQKLQDARSSRFSLREKLASYDNFRQALDNTPEYHIQPYDPQANTSSKKRLYSSSRPTEGKSEEVSPTDAVSSPNRKQAKVEDQTPVEQSERATAALASSSLNPSTQDVVEYSLESAAPREPRGDPRAKDRHYTQKIAALGEQIRRSYYSITATSKENSSLTASSNQADSENSPTNDPGAHASPSFKPH